MSSADTNGGAAPDVWDELRRTQQERDYLVQARTVDLLTDERTIMEALMALLDTRLSPLVQHATAVQVLCEGAGFSTADEAIEALKTWKPAAILEATQ